jgi:hypothetical protein
MTQFLGSALIVQWVNASGTTNIQADYQKFSEKTTIDLVEVTAGADPTKVFLPSFKDYTLNISGFMEQGGTVGALNGTALAEGNIGTLFVGPEGTATTKPKRTYPVISQGITYNHSFNAATEYSIDFQGWGSRVDGTF